MTHRSNTRRARWAATAAVGLLLVQVAVAQMIPPYPAGPPYRPGANPDFRRDLRAELRNKTTDTFTVTSVGDMYWQSPIAKRMSPELRDLMRNADITVGNLEGGLGFDPELTASALNELGVDFAAPGEFGHQPALQAAVQALGAFGIKLASADIDLTRARRPALQERAQGLVAFLAACPGDNLCGDRATNTAQGANPLGMKIWTTVTQEQFNQLKAIEASILARRTEPDVVRPSEMPPTLPAGRLSFMGQNYLVADKPGELRHEPNPADEQAIVFLCGTPRRSRTS